MDAMARAVGAAIGVLLLIDGVRRFCRVVRWLWRGRP